MGGHQDTRASAFRRFDAVVVQQGDQAIPLIQPSTRDYFAMLRRKLRWGER